MDQTIIETEKASRAMVEVESVLLEHDLGRIPVAGDGTKKLLGMATRPDLLRHHTRY